MTWGKPFGFPDDWIHNVEINKIKLNIERFKQAYDEAKSRKWPIFMFDGKQYGLKEADKFLQVALWKEMKQSRNVDYRKKYNI